MHGPWIMARLRAATLAGLLVTMAACADLRAPQPVAAPPAATPPVVLSEPPPPPPPRKPAPPAPILARLPPQDVPEPPPVPGGVERQPAAGGLDRLIGLDQPHTAALLGDPQQYAESPPATIWRYVSQDCEVDVYFYLDLKSQAMRALHYEVRSHDPPERPAQRCYDELVTERRAGVEPAAGTDRAR
ncbi:MAG TPA: hypothetical protein VET85_14540 [Stellaceae bacterium]|nr:hypothetical protein [Stellaceae bacterium]